MTVDARTAAYIRATGLARPKVYLAGPGVFRPDAAAIGIMLKRLCEAQGLQPLWPGDNVPDPAMPRTAAAHWIYDRNCGQIREATAIVADVTPFRGPHLDVGTGTEIGFAAALGRPVFGYFVAHVVVGGIAIRPTELIDRVWCEETAGGEWRDTFGNLVEDFGLVDNLMPAMMMRPEVSRDVESAIARCAAFLQQGAAA